MLTWILLIISLCSIAASWYKDRKIEQDTLAIKKALRINYVIQVLVVLLAAYNVFQNEVVTKAFRIAQNDKEVLVEVSRSQIPILDNYAILLRNASVVRNSVEYTRALSQLSPQLQERTWESIVSSDKVAERDIAVRAFAELQRLSRELIALQLRYGDRVPQVVVEWAAFTLALRFEQLSPLLRDTPEGLRYATMLGNAFGVSVGKLQSTLRRLEQ